MYSYTFFVLVKIYFLSIHVHPFILEFQKIKKELINEEFKIENHEKF